MELDVWLRELACDSITLLELLGSLEKSFGIAFTEDEHFEASMMTIRPNSRV
ncbi:hypothetical protein GXW82_18865 [Streptacidiphilus sp. 4-A2]|nr:hypothetical protein [Streptacidiphilus sp. 4-A2]